MLARAQRAQVSLALPQTGLGILAKLHCTFLTPSLSLPTVQSHAVSSRKP